MRCISKGEAHEKYESGDKVSVIRPAAGIILGAMPFRNEYDGYAIEPSSRQAGRLTGRNEVLAGGKRAGTEPSTGRLKSDCRLARDFHESVVGNVVNALLAAAAYSFKRIMKALWRTLQKTCGILLRDSIPQKQAF